MDYWENYYEPTEFDITMMEFKQSIIENVRQDIKDKIQSLEKENAELSEVKKNWEKLQKEHDDALRELRIRTENAERDAKKARARDILESISVVGYRVAEKREKRPKCGRCDKDRKIHFVSPMGRNMTEYCECDKDNKFYYPKEVKCIEFNIRSDDTISYYYELPEEKSSYDDYSHRAEVYSALPSTDEELEKINYRALFLEEEDCQKYCDWKNSKSKRSDLVGSVDA